MKSQRIFEILGIDMAKDEDEIRATYRSKLVSVHSEDNPEGLSG